MSRTRHFLHDYETAGVPETGMPEAGCCEVPNLDELDDFQNAEHDVEVALTSTNGWERPRLRHLSELDMPIDLQE